MIRIRIARENFYNPQFFPIRFGPFPSVQLW
jgi:hypothetical protein